MSQTFQVGPGQRFGAITNKFGIAGRASLCKAQIRRIVEYDRLSRMTLSAPYIIGVDQATQ